MFAETVAVGRPHKLSFFLGGDSESLEMDELESCPYCLYEYYTIFTIASCVNGSGRRETMKQLEGRFKCFGSVKVHDTSFGVEIRSRLAKLFWMCLASRVVAMVATLLAEFEYDMSARLCKDAASTDSNAIKLNRGGLEEAFLWGGGGSYQWQLKTHKSGVV